MMPRQTKGAKTALAMAVVLSVFAGGVAATAANSGSTSGTPHGAENGNYTVVLPTAEDHYPRGESGPATVHHFAAGTQQAFSKTPAGLENVSFIVISSPDVDFTECTTEDTRAFGIDRDSDDPGTQTDVSLLSYQESNQFNKHSIVVNFYEGGELGATPREDQGGKSAGREDGDRNAELYPDDQIVAVQQDCYQMPKEPGWYQMAPAYVNGTGFNGKFVQIDVPSHYFYVCKCESRQEAEQKLGPPPSQRGDETPSGTQGTSTPTATATPGEKGGQSTPSGTSTPTGTPTSGTPTSNESTPVSNSTEAGTPTPSANTTGNSTSTGTNDSGNASAGNTGGGAASAAGGNASSGAGNASNASTGGGSAPKTPTAGSGPGLGVAAALVGIAAGALLVVRRRR